MGDELTCDWSDWNNDERIVAVTPVSFKIAPLSTAVSVQYVLDQFEYVKAMVEITERQRRRKRK